MSIKQSAQDFLSERHHKIGETVQHGWFLFRIVQLGQPSEIETLDFRQIASFTEDFSQVDRIHALQTGASEQFQSLESPCTLRQAAIVSRSYSPERDDVFLERQSPEDGNDSGWYVGVSNEIRDIDDAASFARRSLYELTILDMRMAPYWPLPPGTVVSLASGEISYEYS